VPAEVGHRQQIGDPPCNPCTAEERQSSGTRKRQCCTRNPERTDVRKEKSIKTRIQQWHKESVFKGAATSRKREDIQQDLEEGSQIAEPLWKINVRMLWRGQHPPEQKRRPLTTDYEPWM
jgi:hypothetical protein